MTNLPVPTLQNILNKDRSSFQISRSSGSRGRNMSSDSDSDGNSIDIAKGRLSASDDDDDLVQSGRRNERERMRRGDDVDAEVGSPLGSERTEKGSSFGSTTSPLLAKGSIGGNNGALTTRPDVGIAPNGAPGQPVKVIVVADVVCPWCYIALRSIQLAIQDLTFSCLDSPSSCPPPRFDIEFRPFFINDNFGSDEIAIDRRAFLEAKFGDKLEEHDKIVKQRGKQLGINFKLGGMLRQTTRAHRLLTLAYRTGGSALQLALLEHLFHASHVEEKDIGNVELLAFYADKVGLLPKATAERWLRTHDLETDVRRLVKISVQGCGIAGVPFVVINGKWAIGGGEDRHVYAKVFEKVWNGQMKN